MLTYIIVLLGILNVLLWYMNSVKARDKFKKQYPDLTVPKSHWVDMTLTIIKGLFMCFCPVLDIAFAYIMIVNSDEICDKTIQSVHAKCIKETKV